MEQVDISKKTNLLWD
uniref:Uncharacterized protein n=1 Tax=Tetraselmis sp. GSL018 TaxID=582737 RepID=A0A061RXB1_9CHLO